ncbi:MAG: transglutaminase-like domain-containing protein [Candidatus Cloacimonadales bacterium]|nr:transglutaminase-like domain-containing protein [Candidatus Cloacimonadales bacterium]
MKKFLVIFLPVLIMVSCTTLRVSEEAAQTIHKAGKNKSELKNAIRYFENKGDSLQLDAVLFLIENMSDQSFVEIVPCDSNKVEIPWNIADYENYQQARTALDSLEKSSAGFDWKANKKIPDQQVITAEFLIQNVEDAFFAWQNLPWAKDYSYKVFKEFILPYRGSNEPLPASISWRRDFSEKYSNLAEQMNEPSDPTEAASIINLKLRSWFKFNEIYYLHPTDQSVDEMQETCQGRCEDMTNLAMAAMRANGIAVTSDYTPYWADSSNNHAWNAIITHDGKAIPFMGCEADPGKYSIRNRVAKVYRKTFAKQTDNLASLLRENEKAPAWLRSENYVDVTEKYTKTADVKIDLNREIPDSVRFAYLCVFNSGEWCAIQWSEIKDGEVFFQEMGVDLCYLPMILEDEKLVSIGVPVILQKDGSSLFLEDNRSIHDLILISTTKTQIANATEEKQIVNLKEGSEYELFYWQDEWQSAGKQIATSEPMIFKDIPADRLYWLVETDSRKEERIFTYEEGKQVWW